ncbi:MAG TPA: GLPGLI family protein [Bacteroidales bacterium]|nr:GLPGLI family protein [Bacteroidales bacterium]HPT03151.1 GLPGLI family protein [Bacteroidales bacterium]
MIYNTDIRKNHTSRFHFTGMITALLLIMLTIDGIAQKPEGYIRYLRTGNWAKQMAAVDYLSKQQRDRFMYMWSSRAEYKSFTNLWFSPAGSKYEDSEEIADRDREGGYDWRKEVFLIMRNFETSRIHDAIQLNGKVYVIEDTLNYPQWKILNDMKEVAGHICMNAFYEDTLKMQKITAWYALDLPVSAGPERLGGLPGVILEVDINDGAMLITADKVEMKPLTDELNPPKKMKGKKVSEEQYLTVLKKHFDDRRADEEPPFWGDVRY